MAGDILTTSSINSLIYDYEVNQRKLLISPLENRKSKYEKLDTAYSDIATKLTSLKSILSDLKNIDTDSIFNQKTTESSNSAFVSATATNSASIGAFEFRVNQLAKNDMVVSNDLATDTLNPITGTHTFTIKTGDGSTGEYISNIEVEFDTDETNATAMEKIRNAINSDKAIVDSTVYTAADTYAGGVSSFTFDINGTETTISVNGGGTYEDLINEIVSAINDDVDGVTAEKIIDDPSTGDVQLRITVDDPDDYITITSDSGFDLVSHLGLGVTKEKGAAGLVTASVFSPTSGNTQLSLSSKLSGVDNRIKELTDIGSSTALNILGLNMGSSRPTFDQSSDPDTAGFVYSDITESNNQLNSKFVFNGLALQNNLNEVSELTSGVTFNLKSTMQDSDNSVGISVGIDTAGIKKKIEDFVTKFNDVYTYIKNASAATSGNRGALLGDSNAASILDSLRNSILTPVSGISTGKLSYFSQIGLSFNYSSGITIADSNLLESKISGSLSQVADLFNSTSGIGNTLYDKFNPYLGAEGYLSNSKSLFNNNVTRIKDRMTAVESRIEKSADVLRSRYQQLQSQLASLTSLQNMLYY